MTKRNDAMLNVVSGLLDSIGITYDSVHANIDPLTFNDYLSHEGSKLTDASRKLDFSACTNHNYIEGMEDLPEDGSSEPEVARFLGRLAFRIEAVRVVEIGCFVGMTTAHLTQALSYLGGKGTVYGIDISKRFLDATLKNLQALGLSHLFQPVHGASLDTSVFESIPSDLDLVFIDSYHNYLNTLREVEIYAQKLSSKGSIVLHDSIKWPGVRKAVAVFAEKFDMITFGTSGGNGLTIMTQKQ